MQGTFEQFTIIDRPYLIVVNVPFFLDSGGQALFDRSWHHDLIRHLQYIPAMALAAPLCPLPADTSTLVALDPEHRAKLGLIPLPARISRIHALAQLISTCRTLWRAVGKADIVHTGIAGWPYPIGWLASPIAKLRRKKLIIIVESAPWRGPAASNDTIPFRRRVEAWVHEYLARFWCSRADLSFYTQPAYREQFHGSGKGPAYIIPATWVNAEDVLDQVQARLLWDAKMPDPVRFLFAGRLVEEKGVRILLAAAEALAAAGVHGELHVIGDGPLRDAVVAAQRGGPFSVRYFKPLPYGAPFLTFLERYHAVVVPSLSDEQPRIIFDAAARAIPVLASDTDGIRPHVDNDRTGRLISPGNVDALAEVMTSSAGNPAALRTYGMEALFRVRSQTHRAMHAQRSQIIARHLLPG